MIKVIENWTLHAFADGELEGEDRKSVIQLLETSEDAKKAYSAIQFQKEQLHKAYNSTLKEVVPANLIDLSQKVGPGSSRIPLAGMVAALVLLQVGGVGGWLVSQKSQALQVASLERHALVAHEVFSVEVKHPVEVSAADPEHLQKWLSKRIGENFQVPQLETAGFTLLGGRLLAGENSPAGQLMYETANKGRLTVYISSNDRNKDEALRIESVGNLVTCFWRDGKLALAVTAEMPQEKMMLLAKDIYDQMETKG